MADERSVESREFRQRYRILVIMGIHGFNLLFRSVLWAFGKKCVLGFPERKGPSSAVGGMQVLLGIAEKEHLMDRKPGSDNLEWMDTWG